MSENRAELVKERIKLQESLREHIAKNGFDYREYVNPPADSWVGQYQKRIKEIDDVLSPELQYWKG
ncbi:hypothetical protein [Thiohalomonas denitrificans]|uniref:Uncharacterized protein n=1 Tax=Thiohalomonas denitrificans TaxID=415747 RepID=A0A1G5QMN1_9GAMM|nr:hypothetical protein [Thiohalomonas denitrificans]SCZ62389.1 hypothetical protein SAMN03097708_02313 [Thiohalomonas denitrificans]